MRGAVPTRRLGVAMPESMPVRCPVCRREHVYTAPVYPCACGTPTAPRLDPAAAPVVAGHRAWDDEWIALPCTRCARRNHWPHPELGCPCGTVLRIPVSLPAGTEIMTETTKEITTETTKAASRSDPMPEPTSGSASTPGVAMGPGVATGSLHSVSASQPPPASPAPSASPSQSPSPSSSPESAPPPPSASATKSKSGTRPAHPARGPAFQPRTIRTARDAVTTAALYLRWLGYRDIRRADQRPPNGIGLAGHGVLAQVDPTVRPAAPRDVECLWLTAMTESADCVYFSLAGYTDDARSRADTLGVPLFVLDLTGTPRPVNASAGDLSVDGA